MSAATEVDTEATGAGLATSAQDRLTAIAGTDITLPHGGYVGATNTLAAELIAARVADLADRVTAVATAARSSVAADEATEQANAAALTT
ncbi:hypothetical protein LV457_04495 [Mycobacterium sp. MYCO198283]|uniref:hypothetical protein n=1 Tax=Mycobacterium sp. MYCO198283 TaxID=2883505 RepID=UPI001E47CB95|nr:hypothetical protein [Mycobacterium sp. MYCO198283]MCG5431549.1 hypothetical protein [Mycobacterium sp. MYCO198283]